MRNTLKTFVLMGSLTALVIGLGALVAPAHLYLFGGLALAMNLGAYFFSDRIVLRMHRAREVTPAEAPDLHAMVGRGARILDAGWVIAIAGEGRIHRGERELLPLADGPAYFALRAGVPVIPLAINGTSWLGFRRTIRLRVGEPISVEGRPTRDAVEALTARTAAALLALVADFPEPSRPGPLFRFLTEQFNEWPEGARPEPGHGDGERPSAPA